MSLTEHSWLMVSCIIGSMILLIILGLFAVRGGSCLSQASSEMLVFRRRPTERIFAAIIGLLFAIGGPLAFWPKILESQDRAGFAFIAFLCFVGSSPLLWRTGPEELCLDLKKRAYRFVNGPPFFPKIYTGSWADIAGMYVWSAHQGYIISLAWKDRNRHKPMLGRFRYRADATQFANETASALRLSHISAP